MCRKQTGDVTVEHAGADDVMVTDAMIDLIFPGKLGITAVNCIIRCPKTRL